MKTRLALFATGLYGLAVLAGPAYASDASSLIQQVEAKYSKVDAIQAKFTQTTHNPTFGDDKQSGDVTLKRPKKMRWNFTSGAKKQFVTDGSTMWIYSADDNQVIKTDVSSGGGQADELLTSLDKLDQVFTVDELADPSPGHHALDLQPKAAGHVKKIHMELTPDLLVEKVVITDAFDNVTELDFTDVKLNGSVADSAFKFEVPKGAQVVDTTSAAAGASTATPAAATSAGNPH